MLSDASACADGAPRCVGICSPACDVYPGDCSRDLAGTWTGVATLDQCKARCRGCSRCRSISFDAAQKECLWFFDCQADGLFRARFAESFTTVRLKPAAPPSWASRNASSEASQHDRCEIWPCRLAYPTPLATRATAQRRGTTRTLRMSTALATEGPWLSASMAARGVRGARNNSRLACFFGRARRRPVQIVALGGSITAGLSYGPGLSHAASDEDASQRMPYQYHAVFERWVRAAFARHGSGEHSSRNLGVPANGPALFATCLSNLAGPVAPDLALLEFGVNTEPDDLPAFEALLRGLHRANVPTVVVNVDRFGPWDHCKWAHCRDPSSFARYEPDSQVLRVLPARPVIQPHACACAPARLLARVSRVAEQLLVSPTSRSPSRAHAAAGACPGADREEARRRGRQPAARRARGPHERAAPLCGAPVHEPGRLPPRERAGPPMARAAAVDRGAAGGARRGARCRRRVRRAGVAALGRCGLPSRLGTEGGGDRLARLPLCRGAQARAALPGRGQLGATSRADAAGQRGCIRARRGRGWARRLGFVDAAARLPIELAVRVSRST